MSNNPLDAYDCEVIYRGELIGVTNTAGRHELIHQAIREGRIALPFRTYDLEFRWVLKKDAAQ
jgi:hypothetical protein